MLVQRGAETVIGPADRRTIRLVRVPGQIEAVVFDMDGVLVDTEHLWDEVREELTARVGRAVHARGAAGDDGDELARVVALPPRRRRAARAARRRSTREVVRRMLARYEVDLPVVPGAVDAVRRARCGGLPARASRRRRTAS